jgi:hypothetical protein
MEEREGEGVFEGEGGAEEVCEAEGVGEAEREVQLLAETLRVALEQPLVLELPLALTLAQLEGVWELRWSSSQQPYLAVGPWLENLQLLAPSLGRGMNLLRLPGPLAPLAAIAVEASIALETSDAEGSPTECQQRVRVCFERGGWLGPSLGAGRLQLLRRVLPVVEALAGRCSVQQRGVGVHHALRVAGGAAGEEHRGHVAGLAARHRVVEETRLGCVVRLAGGEQRVAVQVLRCELTLEPPHHIRLHLERKL